MNEIRLNCGIDILCGHRKGKRFCPYYDNEDCKFFRPDIVEEKQEGEPAHATEDSKDKGMSLESIAKSLIRLSEEYLAGEMPDEVYRPLVGAFGMSAMRISPRQAEMMLTTAKMDIVTKQLDSLDTPEKVIKSIRKSSEGETG